MKQLFLKQGSVTIENVPAQLVDDNGIKVEVTYSFISPGTEISGLVKSGQSLLKKAIAQPRNIKKFVDRAHSKGLSSTVSEVKTKSEIGLASGYSLSGKVLEVGRNITAYRAGELVACAGGGIATHAEVVVAPKNLVVRVPEGCSLKAASSVAIGSIALQGVRRAEARIGETIAVVGLGLIGQITVQLLNVAGCHVIGIDPDERRVKVAIKQGMDHGFSSSRKDSIENVHQLTGGLGADVTIICAASRSNELAQQAMEMTRKKGKVVIVGDVGLGLQRKPFYEKEIDFLISCSYGPGRYDHKYEIEGIDYPKAYIRWAENENMNEYLKLIAKKRLDIESLIERTYPLEQAVTAYEELRTSDDKPLGVVLEYKTDEDRKQRKETTKVSLTSTDKKGRLGVAVVGTGSFATSVHLPNLNKLKESYSLQALVGRTGAVVSNVAKRFTPEYISTDYQDILKDPEVDLVMVCTRHNLHAPMAIEALRAGKAVFLEKPMAMNQEELDELVAVYEKTGSRLPFMVGFNRRFSPAAVKAKRIIEVHKGPMVVLYRVKANPVPAEHWVQSSEGGGRIIGEACHMIDLFNFFTGSNIVSIDAEGIASGDTGLLVSDNFAATLKYADGSVCTLVYTSQGSAKTSKEYIEIFSENQTIIIDDFRKLRVLERSKLGWSSRIGDKGHVEELKAFAQTLRNGKNLPIPFEDLVKATKISFLIHQMLRS